ncbi:MAG: NADH-quinone oxidoreductase subunit N [Ignavibacteriae bacterium]|nr:NADH-quinone oxidoreductase subunit N [Ignavibacteriota bacterium]
MPDIILQSTTHFWPEITLALTFILAMIIEFAAGRRSRPNGAKATGILVFVGLAAALIQLPFSPDTPVSIFSGMYAVDPFSVFFKYLIIVTSMVIVVFSLQSRELLLEARHTGEYYCFIAALTLGMVLMSGAANLLMMYIAIELVSLTSYILAGFSKSLRRSSEAALKYVLYGGVSSGVMLYGISILFGLTGTLDLGQIRTALASGHAVTTGWSFAALMASIVMMLAGFGYKISAVPFHFWTPDVYEGAPITITAFLAVASKAAGFALMIRFFVVAFFDSMVSAGSWATFKGLDWNIVLATLSVLTMTLGNFVAIWQDNLKRMLAYSSIAHAGYLLMGLVVLSNNGLAALMLYFIMYFFMNLGAFYVVMVVADKIGSEHIDDYKGLGRRAPVLSVGLSLFLISLTGLPPTAGFVGKLFLFSAVMESQFIWLAIVGVLNSVVSLYYYVRVMKNMYLREAPGGDTSPLKFSPGVIATVVLFIVPNLLFGLYFQPLVSFAQKSVTILMPVL